VPACRRPQKTPILVGPVLYVMPHSSPSYNRTRSVANCFRSILRSQNACPGSSSGRSLNALRQGLLRARAPRPCKNGDLPRPPSILKIYNDQVDVLRPRLLPEYGKRCTTHRTRPKRAGTVPATSTIVLPTSLDQRRPFCSSGIKLALNGSWDERRSSVSTEPAERAAAEARWRRAGSNKTSIRHAVRHSTPAAFFDPASSLSGRRTFS